MKGMIPIYWINLDESVERRDRFIMDLGSLENKRITAIRHERPMVGCCLSHIRAVWTAWNDGHDMVIVCEDDADIRDMPLVFDRIHQILRSMPVGTAWEILQIQHTEPNFAASLNRILRQRMPKNVLVRNYLYGCVAYLINRRGMDRFVRLMTRDAPDGGYTVAANFDHPRAHSEELVYRYLECYMSVFPLMGFHLFPSLIREPEDALNRSILSAKRMTDQNLMILRDTPYDVSHDIFDLDYDEHWFNTMQRSDQVIHQIFANADH